MKIEEIHDCGKCHGKIVMIAKDALGNTYCGYCGKQVPYKYLDTPEGLKKLIKRTNEKI